jgi:hypothetical protein
MNFYVDYLEFFGYKRQLHIDRVRYTRGDKIYEQILLRESYRGTVQPKYSGSKKVESRGRHKEKKLPTRRKND